MGYRPDIDGLRAIAIIFVVLFHAGLSIFPSGFVGVDIFFVISGFLITQIIQEALTNNNFSFATFYSRRLWRLQPVFLCLLCILIIVSFIYLLPDDLVAFSKSARKSTLFTANSFFKNFTGNYFAPNSNELPLLHMWSLSIEWQCYLLLPLGLYALHKSVKADYRALVIYLLTLGFLLLSMYFSWDNPTKTYYQLVSRIFEFLIGASIAMKQQDQVINKYLLNGVTLVAVGVIFYIASLQDIHSNFPNGYAFILCGATALLIFAGQQPQKSWVTYTLSTKPLVFIGLLSYSLYLWHWPIFAVSHYLNVDHTPSVLFILFSGIVAIAYFSWRYIEKPARQFSRMGLSYSVLLLFILPLMSVHVADSFIQKNHGYLARFKELEPINKVLKEYDYALRPQCLDDKSTEVNLNCLLGAPNGAHLTGFMIGDSFSNQYWGFVDKLARDANISVLAHAVPSCLALPGIIEIGWYDKNKPYSTCYAFNQRYYEMIKNKHFDYVVLAENWSGYLGDKIINKEGDKQSLALSKKRISQALDDALNQIIASGAKPVIIKSIALSNTNTYNCFYKHIKHRKKYDATQCAYPNQQHEQAWFDTLFATLQTKYRQLIVIDPKRVQCINGLCQAELNGVPLFRDDIHITDYASSQWGFSYLKQFDNPLS